MKFVNFGPANIRSDCIVSVFVIDRNPLVHVEPYRLVVVDSTGLQHYENYENAEDRDRRQKEVLAEAIY